jgi:hypothetical protein
MVENSLSAQTVHGRSPNSAWKMPKQCREDGNIAAQEGFNSACRQARLSDPLLYQSIVGPVVTNL